MYTYTYTYTYINSQVHSLYTYADVNELTHTQTDTHVSL